MAQLQIQRLSPKHDAIMNWLIENPEKPRSVCAAVFGVSESWLSVVINSDCFQAKLHERQDRVFSVIAADLPTKLRGVADLALSRVAAHVPVAGPDYALDVMGATLKALGFGAKPHGTGPTVVQQNNTTVFASAKDLHEARQVMDAVGRTQTTVDVAPDAYSVLPRLTGT